MTRLSGRAAAAAATVLAVWVLAPAAPAAQGRRAEPRVSPHESTSATVDGCDLTITYGRPSRRGRAIWGALVPFGHWWTPGADEATTLTTTKAIMMNGLAVPAGEHTLYMFPDERKPQLIVNGQTGQWHTRYDPDRDLGRVDLTLRRLDAPVEQLTFAIETRAAGGGVVRLIWDDREYSVPFTVAR